MESALYSSPSPPQPPSPPPPLLFPAHLQDKWKELVEARVRVVWAVDTLHKDLDSILDTPTSCSTFPSTSTSITTTLGNLEARYKKVEELGLEANRLRCDLSRALRQYSPGELRGHLELEEILASGTSRRVGFHHKRRPRPCP